MISAVSEVHDTGVSPGTGTFSCTGCGSQVALDHLDQLPECPRCGAARFRRSSIFDAPADPAEQHSGTVEFLATQRPAGLAGMARGGARPAARKRPLSGLHGRELEIFQLEEGWTRIGRSASADVRLDDPSVSRRHALIVWEPGEELRVLDDRSLNGIWLNGALVDWGTIADGDELLIGRYRLFLLSG